MNYSLDMKTTGLLIIDVQEKLFHLTNDHENVLRMMQMLIRGMRILNLPVIVTEQYPQGLGHTIEEVKTLLDPQQQYLEKTCFSVSEAVSADETFSKISQWVLVGIEAHVCVLHSVKDLLLQKKQVVIANDAISSRYINDCSTAIEEMRGCGARISTAEAIIFELAEDSKTPKFKDLMHLFKQR